MKLLQRDLSTISVCIWLILKHLNSYHTAYVICQLVFSPNLTMQPLNDYNYQLVGGCRCQSVKLQEINCPLISWRVMLNKGQKYVMTALLGWLLSYETSGLNCVIISIKIELLPKKCALGSHRDLDEIEHIIALGHLCSDIKCQNNWGVFTWKKGAILGEKTGFKTRLKGQLTA